MRFYFFALAIIMFSPANERLYGKRVCQNAGFKPDFSFQIKAGMKAAPITTFFLMAAVLILSLSYVVRIFERPYFTFNFTDSGVTFYTFESLSSSIWFTIITMTSVGYGGIISTTPVGRFFTIISTIVGAFLLSLLVAIITDWFIIEERQSEALVKMDKDRCAVDTVRAAFQYNIMRAKRYKLLQSGNEEGEHIPTVQELTLLKEKMYAAGAKFR